MTRARLTISSGLGPVEVRTFVARLADALIEQSAARGFVVEDVVVHGEPSAPRSIDLGVIGDLSRLASLVGTHVLVERSPARSRHDRKRWYARVALGDVPTAAPIVIAPSDVRIDTARAGGPGGQHVQKTESAVRVLHVPTGITVRVASERSQHQNRSRALERLAEALAERAANERASDKTRRRDACLQVERGRPVMTWRAREGVIEESADAT